MIVPRTKRNQNTHPVVEKRLSSDCAGLNAAMKNTQSSGDDIYSYLLRELDALPSPEIAGRLLRTIGILLNPCSHMN